MSSTAANERIILPYSFARHHGVVVNYAEGAATAICRKNIRPTALMEARRMIRRPLTVTFVEEGAFERSLTGVYETQAAEQVASADTMRMDHEEDLDTLVDNISDQADILDMNDAPIIRFINGLLGKAVKSHASDLHIEPSDSDVVVRMRVDGILQEVVRLRRVLAPALIARIKIMAKLDIAERRVPQDGHMALRMGGHEFDVRVSTIPSNSSERVVLRLMDKEHNAISLESLGFTQRDFGTFHKIISRPHGLVLVTGPTGSGKTTTLYAALKAINDGKRSILTIEDPVEVALEGIGQTQVNPKVDMTFAKGLRAILRQDPDVVMVGEIRDTETAQIAIQASLTGHMVFSTLHTNSAIGAVTRLYDMGVEPFLLASSLAGIMAQRLVRKLCMHCREPYLAEPHELNLLDVKTMDPTTLYRAVGCDACHSTGYRGRIGIYEIVTVDDQLRSLIHDNQGERAYENYVSQMTPSILEDARKKILEGITTIEEVLRVVA